MKILHLTLKKKWFDLIATGLKTVEYRELKPYWKKRLLDKQGKCRKDFDEIHFRNGYLKSSPFMRVSFADLHVINFIRHKIENGERLSGRYFAIYLGSVLELK